MLPCFLLLQSFRPIRPRRSRRRLSEYQPTPPIPTMVASPFASVENAAESAPTVTPQKSCDRMAMKVFIGGEHSRAVGGGQSERLRYGPDRQKERTGPHISADPSLGASLFAGGASQLGRLNHFFSGATVMRTVSPEFPGKFVNIDSTRLGTRYWRWFEVETASALPSNRRWLSAARSIFRVMPLV